MNIVKQNLLNKNSFWKIYEVIAERGLMQILGLLGVYFDAAVVEVEKNLLLFRLPMAILRKSIRF